MINNAPKRYAPLLIEVKKNEMIHYSNPNPKECEYACDYFITTFVFFKN